MIFITGMVQNKKERRNFMNKSKTVCPICDSFVKLPDTIEGAELITCVSCSNRLEIKKNGTDTKLVEAPKIEEDWGE